jgi:hypothetical protein
MNSPQDSQVVVFAYGSSMLASPTASAASSAAQSAASSTGRGEFHTIVGVKIVIQARL